MTSVGVVRDGEATEIEGCAAALCALIAERKVLSPRVASICAFLIEQADMIEGGSPQGTIEVHYAADGIKLFMIREKVAKRAWLEE